MLVRQSLKHKLMDVLDSSNDKYIKIIRKRIDILRPVCTLWIIKIKEGEMRATEFLAVNNGENPMSQEITHLERLPKKKWEEEYLDLVELPECLLRGEWRQ